MDSLNKRDVDFQTGKLKREKTASDLNKHLKFHRMGIHFERNQPLLKTMSISEKNKNNILQNYLVPAPFEKAMTLHYSLVKGKRKIPFIFCYKDGGGFYLKLPKEYKGDPDGYLKLLGAFLYHVIIVEEGKEDRYSQVIPISIIRKHWKYGMLTSKGNTNRLTFYGSISKIVYLKPDEELLFSASLLQSLKALF